MTPEVIAIWIAGFALLFSGVSLGLEIRREIMGGARLRMTYMTNAVFVMPGIAVNKNKRHISITVSNRGDSPTTITLFGFVYYPSFWAEFFKRKSVNLIITPRGTGMGSLPHLLAPGANWTGWADQTKDLEKMLESGRLWAWVRANHSDKATKIRLIPYTPPKGKKLKGKK